MKQYKLKREKRSWTEEEDSKLKNYFDEEHEEGHWDIVASKLGLRRSGNSTRLRWVNYLKPGVRRRNITDEEMLSILLLQFKWRNKWSTIAKQLCRTDNEIKNFWYTRVKREAKKLNCELKSTEFLETVTRRLVEKMKVEGKMVDSSLICPTAYDEFIRLFPDLAVKGGNAAAVVVGVGTTMTASTSTVTVNHTEVASADAVMSDYSVGFGYDLDPILICPNDPRLRLEQFLKEMNRTYEHQQHHHQQNELLRFNSTGFGCGEGLVGFNQVQEAAMQPSLAPSVVAGGGTAVATDYFGGFQFVDPEYGDLGHIWDPDDPNNYRLELGGGGL